MGPIWAYEIPKHPTSGHGTLEHQGFAAYTISIEWGPMTPRKSLGLGFVKEIQTFASVVCIYSVVTSGVIYEHKCKLDGISWAPIQGFEVQC